MSAQMVSARERRALDKLVGVALLDDDLLGNLLNGPAPDLLASFALSSQTKAWLRSVEAESLEELAQAIHDYVHSPHDDVPS